jgi:hypothetical protein
MSRLLAFLELLWLRWCLSSDEQWVRECESDGILQSDSLRYIRAEAEAYRVRIALLEKQLRPERRVTRSI